jgi:hypothetical protein
MVSNMFIQSTGFQLALAMGGALLFSALVWVSYGIFYLMLLSSNDNDRETRSTVKYKLMDMTERAIIFILSVNVFSTWFILVPFVLYRFYVRRNEKIWFLHSTGLAIISAIIYKLIL